uniref:Uncharacterized protein n=1 Tax=Heterorhabditis bacteriophora TaxID=37862 RepID=A0A1I7W9B4_HETBA
MQWNKKDHLPGKEVGRPFCSMTTLDHFELRLGSSSACGVFTGLGAKMNRRFNCLQVDVVFLRRNPKLTREMAEGQILIALYFIYYGNKVDIWGKNS